MAGSIAATGCANETTGSAGTVFSAWVGVVTGGAAGSAQAASPTDSRMRTAPSALPRTITASPWMLRSAAEGDVVPTVAHGEVRAVPAGGHGALVCRARRVAVREDVAD